ncbi:MAG: DNA repair protein RadC [Candidatus Hydrothermarchaeales archaeon]
MTEYRVRILDLPKEERPRERMKQHGAESLSNAELLAIILRIGTKEDNVINLSNRILKDFNINQLSRATVAELSKIHGIKDAKACQIVACFELARRLESYSDKPKPKIKSPEDANKAISPKLRNLKKETFKALYLDTKNQLIREETISIGSLDASVVHPREVFKTAIAESAAAVILAHNHPSGDPSPSRHDIELTKRLIESGNIMGIEVLDHIIVGDGSFVSLKERGLMEEGDGKSGEDDIGRGNIKRWKNFTSRPH